MKNSVPRGAAQVRIPIAFRAANAAFEPALFEMLGTLRLFWIEAERLELPAPFCRQIADSLDANAAGQASFYRRFDQIRSQEGERDRHVDPPNAAPLTSAKLGDISYSAGDDII
jgi:hypothetical protein